MSLRIILICSLLMFHSGSFSQTNDTLNRTDKNGMKQGRWIKKYSDGHIQYNGYFKDNKPVGIFKRYFENDTLNSVLVFSDDSQKATASLYFSNGFIASEGNFINQLKDGKWKFYSPKLKGYLICEEEYKSNIRNGISLKYYTNNTLAEKVIYINDIRNGEWLQYFSNGNICLKANYLNGKLQGSFTVYFDNGKPQYIGQYKEDTRDGIWKIYNSSGSLKYNVEYKEGVAANSEINKKESEFLDSLEKNKGKIADPAITGTILK